MSEVLITLHILAAVIWVGGMFFAYIALRPAAGELDPPIRTSLHGSIFARFFPWVWAAIIILPVTGYLITTSEFGSFFGGAGAWHVHTMQLLGGLMILLFLHLYFAPYKRLKKALAVGDTPAAGAALAKIRRTIGINLILGLVVVIVATYGRGII